MVPPPKHCSDGVQNNVETDVDCGGDVDCNELACYDNACFSSNNTLADGDETDVDRGGSTSLDATTAGSQ